MLYFECDYNNSCHPKVMEALANTAAVRSPGYDDDPWTASAKEKIRAACAAPKADITFTGGGTQTNAIVVAALLHETQGVVAAETGHVAAHESGAIEYTGHKVITLPAHEGKVAAEDLRNLMQAYLDDPSHEHIVRPGMLYISQPTEYGTLYSKAELTALHQVCREFGLPLYADGARLLYALESPANDVTLADMASLCDAFYIGGTKCGTLCGEALVFPQGAPKYFFSTVKQHGGLFAKGRLNGVQFDALFTDGLYTEIGRHTAARTEELKAMLKELGIRFFKETPTNQQFVLLPKAVLPALAEQVRYTVWEPYDAESTVVRFCASWATTTEEIAQLKAVLQDLGL